MLELTQKRTLHSKTHDLGNGQHRITASPIPLHYEESGEFLDIDMTIKNGAISSGLYKVELMTNKVGFHAIDRVSNKKISVSLGKIGNHHISYSPPTVDGNKAVWKSIKPGVDIELVFNPHQVNIFRVLQNAEAEKEAEWEVEEDIGDKSIRMSTKVFGRDHAKKETKHTVIIVPKEESSQIKKYSIRDTFDNKVLDRNPKTRVKTESTNVAYPVRIDPTVTITISNTADDGFSFRRKKNGVAVAYGYIQTGYSNNLLSHYSTSYGGDTYVYNKRVFNRFPGITIPQSSTINSATLKNYITSKNFDLPASVFGKNQNNPAAPTMGNQLFTGLHSVVPTKVLTTAAGNYTSINVQALVQALVNAFDYSNEAMLLILNTEQAGAFLQNTVNFEDTSNPSSNSPQLVIDYTPGGGGGSNIKTWNGLADASVKTVNGLARASVKTRNGLA